MPKIKKPYKYMLMKKKCVFAILKIEKLRGIYLFLTLSAIIPLSIGRVPESNLYTCIRDFYHEICRSDEKFIRTKKNAPIRGTYESIFYFLFFEVFFSTTQFVDTDGCSRAFNPESQMWYQSLVMFTGRKSEWTDTTLRIMLHIVFSIFCIFGNYCRIRLKLFFEVILRTCLDFSLFGLAENNSHNNNKF